MSLKKNLGAMAQYSQIFYLLRSTGLFGTPRPTLKRSMIINYYALDFRIDFSLRVCFAQLPSQSIISQDSELAVFAQKLKRDCKLQKLILFIQKNQSNFHTCPGCTCQLSLKFELIFLKNNPRNVMDYLSHSASKKGSSSQL